MCGVCETSHTDAVIVPFNDATISIRVNSVVDLYFLLFAVAVNYVPYVNTLSLSTEAGGKK